MKKEKTNTFTKKPFLIVFAILILMGGLVFAYTTVTSWKPGDVASIYLDFVSDLSNSTFYIEVDQDVWGANEFKVIDANVSLIGNASNPKVYFNSTYEGISLKKYVEQLDADNVVCPNGEFGTDCYYAVIVGEVVGDMELENCHLYNISTDTFLYWNNVSSGYEYARAELMQCMYNGETAQASINPRLNNTGTYTQNIRGVYVDDDRDVGRYAYYSYLKLYNDGNKQGSIWYNCSFDLTVGNENVSYWYELYDVQENTGNAAAEYYLPSGSIERQKTTPGTTDGFGSDTSAEQQDNPADFRLRVQADDNTAGGATGAVVKILTLSKVRVESRDNLNCEITKTGSTWETWVNWTIGFTETNNVPRMEDIDNAVNGTFNSSVTGNIVFKEALTERIGSCSGDPCLIYWNVSSTTLGTWFNLSSLGIGLTASPSAPTLTFTNESIWFSTPDFVCSGSTDPEGETINYQFYGKGDIGFSHQTASGTTTDYIWTDWEGPQPNAAGDNCVELTAATAAWNDNTCGSSRQYICENLNGSYRDMAPASDTWENAKADCEGEGANWSLAAISSYEEAVIFNTTYNSDIHWSAGTAKIGAGTLTDRWWQYDDLTHWEILQNSTSTALELGRVEGEGEVKCRACDEFGACSAYTETKTYYGMNFYNCTSGNIALNLSFIDEATGNSLNATIPGISLSFNSEDNYTYSFSEANTNQTFFKFCLDPENITIGATGNIRYKYGDDYPLRTFYFDDNLNGNTTYEQILYLLDANDGIYSTIQVQTAGGSPIEDVLIVVSRIPLGESSYVTIEQKETDAAGSAQFFLNPDYEHRFIVSKTGYVTQTVYLVPTQETYTIQLPLSSSGVSYTADTQGMLWKINPPAGLVKSGTTYDFEFNITASRGNLIGCMFNITNSTDDQVASAIGCASSPYTGGNISTTYTVQRGDKLFGAYYIKVDAECNDDLECSAGPLTGETCAVDADCEVWGIIDSDMAWREFNESVSSWNTLRYFFADLSTMGEFGVGGEGEFSRIVWFFLIMTIVIGAATFFTGWETNSDGAAILFVAVVILFGSIAGFFDLLDLGFTGAWVTWIEKFTVSLIVIFFALGWWFNDLRRKQTG